MDKFTTKPLHEMTRMDAIQALQQCRAELLDARQRIKDLEGEVQTLIECDGHSPKYEVARPARIRR